MKKYLLSFFLFPSVAFSAPEFSESEWLSKIYNQQATSYHIGTIISLLNSFASQYPQCYADVAEIKTLVDELSVVFSPMGELYTDVSQLNSNLDSVSLLLRDIYSQISSSSSDDSPVSSSLFSSYLNSVLSSFEILSYQLDQVNGSIQNIDALLSSSIPLQVEIDNLDDIQATFTAALNAADLTVSLSGGFPPITITNSNDFSFNYDWFKTIKDFYSRAGASSYFSLNRYYSYSPNTWLFNKDVPMSQLISVTSTENERGDILDFLCSCGNALVSQNSNSQKLLCQILGFLKSAKADDEALQSSATAAADDAPSDLDGLRSAFGVSSVEDVADRYFADLSLDDHFDKDFLGFAHGSGHSLPESVFIGPVPFSKIVSSLSDMTFQIPLSGLTSFFDICRQCFTVIWYLFFLTIAIFLARLSWAFVRPVISVAGKVLDW